MNKEFLPILEKIEQSLSSSLNMNFSQEWKNASFENIPSAIKNEYIQKLIEPNEELISLGGKRWRPLLLILCYKMIKQTKNPIISEEEVYSLTPLVEFVHTASLIHDDIEDNAELRRGKPSAHISYGLDTALNAASWLYFEAPVCINNLNANIEFKNQLYQIYTSELRKLHLGQAMDIFWHRNPDFFPTEDEYKSMVKCKTGTLASLAAQIGCISAGETKENAIKIGEIAANIGIGFQIIDDVINLTSGNVGKKRGDDIVEGKKSLPVLLHIKNHPEDKKIISNFMKTASQEGINSFAVEECIKLLESSNCIKETEQEGALLIKENCKLLNSDLIQNLFTNMIPKF